MNIFNYEHLTRNKGLVLVLGAAMTLAGVLIVPGQAFAQPVVMNDNGSTASIDLVNGGGMNSWTVNGQNQLNQQWFWYRTGNGVAQPINSIGGLSVTTYNGANGINEVTATYQNAQLSVSIDYYLTGGGVGSGNADMSESISVINKSASPLNLNFYQYSYFNLLGAGNDTVNIIGDPVNGFNFVRQANGATAIQEAVTSPNANYAEAAAAGQTLNELNTQANLTLNDNLTSGPGTETWALQWTDAMNPGDEFDIMKDKTLSIQTVPEPSIMAILGLGAGAMGFVLRRKKA